MEGQEELGKGAGEEAAGRPLSIANNLTLVGVMRAMSESGLACPGRHLRRLDRRF
jgi:hypothetical protein